MEIIKALYDYFPTSVFTGKALVFISEDWRVELTEHRNSDFSKIKRSQPVVRIKFFKRALNGEFIPGHYEDFDIVETGELATRIERYIQAAAGKNIKEYGSDDGF
ncbi:MAG: hypothetical protein K8R02_08175 [Anaerohalosphaeraceae bacterium]|nr:hypothetical protein [Anaerohalosphaeraceae bacterium]